MSDENREDLAIEYVLGMLEPAAARAFEADIQKNPEIARLVDELREGTSALVHALPQQPVPPHLREKILSIPRGESMPAGPGNSRALPWLPWAIAASLAIATGLLFTERNRAREDSRLWQAESDRWRTEAELQQQEAAAAKLVAQQIDERATTLQMQTTALEEEVADLKKKDAFAKLQIATLSAQVATLAGAEVVVVWDAANQRGRVKVANLPKAEGGKDYQLWVIDPKYPAPVSAGVLSVSADGSASTTFVPDKEIATPDKFAISVEKAGGAPAPGGPIVFIGN